VFFTFGAPGFFKGVIDGAIFIRFLLILSILDF